MTSEPAAGVKVPGRGVKVWPAPCPSGSRPSRPGRFLLPAAVCLASAAGAGAQPIRTHGDGAEDRGRTAPPQPVQTQGWVFGFGSGAAAVSFDGDPTDGAALVGFRVGYGLNRVVAPYAAGAYADIRSRGLEAFDRATFTHVDLGVRLHWAGDRRRWVPHGDLALTFWRVDDVVRNGEPTGARFTSAPTLSVGGGVAVHLSESWALDVNVKAAGGAFEGVPVGRAPPGGHGGHSAAPLDIDAASVRLGVGLAWRP